MTLPTPSDGQNDEAIRNNTRDDVGMNPRNVFCPLVFRGRLRRYRGIDRSPPAKTSSFGVSRAGGREKVRRRKQIPLFSRSRPSYHGMGTTTAHPLCGTQLPAALPPSAVRRPPSVLVPPPSTLRGVSLRRPFISCFSCSPKSAWSRRMSTSSAWCAAAPTLTRLATGG